jgi:putative addiction module component (TIGR02574 family)
MPVESTGVVISRQQDIHQERNKNMNIQEDQLFAEAMTLPPKERVDLAERLLSSIDLVTQQENDMLWAQEAERRIDSFGKGEIKSVQANEVFRKIKAKKK